MKTIMQFSKKYEKGQVLVLVAILMVGLLGMAALIVDFGATALERRELQNAADAAALAGASMLPNCSKAVYTAIDYAVKNGVPQENVSCNPTNINIQDRIEVVVTSNVVYTFAQVLGFMDVDVNARAVAQKYVARPGYAIFHGSDEKELKMNHDNLSVVGSVFSNGNFVANGDDIAVNVDSTVYAAGNIIIDGDDIDIPNQEQVNIYPLEQYVKDIGLDDDDPDTLDFVQREDGPGADPETVKIESCTTITESIIATKEIIFDQECSLTVGSPEKPVLIYAKGSDGYIKIAKGDLTIYGILYAPNGYVNINHSEPHEVRIFGMIVADDVQINGPKLTVDSTDMNYVGFPGVTLVE
jgi:hypothetical protein